MLNNDHIKRVYTEPDKVADEVAERLEKMISQTKPAQKIRNSQILTVMLGACGLALFILGVEKIFDFLPGIFLLLLGLIFLLLTGALLKKL